jgi:hypothetical protein
LHQGILWEFMGSKSFAWAVWPFRPKNRACKMQIGTKLLASLAQIVAYLILHTTCSEMTGGKFFP